MIAMQPHGLNAIIVVNFCMIDRLSFTLRVRAKTNILGRA